ncbi:MAG: hypothetical protein V4651_03260, partial [Bacteroidota bacterium]
MKKILHIVCLVMISFNFAEAQVTLNTTIGSTGYTGTNSSGAGSFITFAIQNNSSANILLTDVGNWSTAATSNTYTLYYSSTSLGGTVSLTAPDWTQIATGTATVVASVVNPVLSGINFVIPIGVTYRFALFNTGTNSYSGTGVGTCTPNTFTAAGSGVNLLLGDIQIGGQYVGYGATNNPRFFTGSITYSVVAGGGPTTIPPIASYAYTKTPQDTVWVASPRTIVNTSSGADKSYWDIIGYNAVTKNGPYAAF